MGKKLLNCNLWFILLITFSVLFQIHCAIHGFDLTDEGYLMSIYQWLGTDPYYAQGAGGYPLTGYLGWILNQTFPEGGILCMRLWGVLIVILTEIGLFFFLRRHFPPLVALIGLSLQVIFLSGDPKPFGYNTLSAFFSVLGLISLLSGMRRHNSFLLLVAGLILGINVFIRIPNLACVAFVVLPLLANDRKDSCWLRTSIIQSMWVCLGFFAGIGAGWMLLLLLGLDSMVLDFFHSIFGTLGGNSTHASSSLLSKYLSNYALSVWLFAIFMLAYVIGSFGVMLKRKVLTVLLFVASFLIIYRNTYMDRMILSNNIPALMNGIGIIGSCYYLNKGTFLRSIAIGGILLSIILPLGSDGGFQTMWVGTWLALPVGVSGLYEMITRYVDDEWLATCTFTRRGTATGKVFSLDFSSKGFKGAYLFCLFAFVFAAVVKIERKCYYDPGNRMSKMAVIDSPLAKGIYTTKERADIINSLMKGIELYVNPQDTLLVYASSPMVYYLTQTKPFAGVSWPCVYYGQQYVEQFEKAEKNASRLPVLILQCFGTSNEWSRPQPDFYDPEVDTAFSSKEMTRCIFDYMERNKYHKVWTNDYYEIWKI